MTRKAIPVKIARVLCARSGNKCAFPNCTEELFTTYRNVGEICHIEGVNPGSARYNPNLSEKEVHDISNLILLCSNHHKEIDENPEKYTIEKLKSIKEVHEERVSRIWRENVIDLCQEVGRDTKKSRDTGDKNKEFYTELIRIFQRNDFNEMFLSQSFDTPLPEKIFEDLSNGCYAIRVLLNRPCATKIPGNVRKELLEFADLIEYLAYGIAICFDSNEHGYAVPNAGRWIKQNAEAIECCLKQIQDIYKKYNFR